MEFEKDLIEEAKKRYPEEINNREIFIEGARWGINEYMKEKELNRLKAELAMLESEMGVKLEEFLGQNE